MSVRRTRQPKGDTGAAGAAGAAGATGVGASGRVVLTGGNFTTTSTSFVDVTGATLDITVSANSRLLICTSGSGGSQDANQYLAVDVVIDGVSQGGTYGVSMLRSSLSSPNDGTMPLGIAYLSDTLSADTYTVKLQARVNAGANGGLIWASSTCPLVLSVVEIKT